MLSPPADMGLQVQRASPRSGKAALRRGRSAGEARRRQRRQPQPLLLARGTPHGSSGRGNGAEPLCPYRLTTAEAGRRGRAEAVPLRPRRRRPVHRLPSPARPSPAQPSPLAHEGGSETARPRRAAGMSAPCCAGQVEGAGGADAGRPAGVRGERHGHRREGDSAGDPPGASSGRRGERGGRSRGSTPPGRGGDGPARVPEGPGRDGAGWPHASADSRPQAHALHGQPPGNRPRQGN